MKDGKDAETGRHEKDLKKAEQKSWRRSFAERAVWISPNIETSESDPVGWVQGG